MNDDHIYLADILERIERIELYTKGGKETFYTSLLIQDGVIRSFEVIGEAVKQLSPAIRAPAVARIEAPPVDCITLLRATEVKTIRPIKLSTFFNPISANKFLDIRKMVCSLINCILIHIDVLEHRILK